MKKLNAIITLIRLPNLVFIFLTQIVAWYSMIHPYILNMENMPLILANGFLFVFAFSTALIAAAGYIINDYFDIGIDVVNKPERVTIEKIFKRRTIIIWHIVLNILALFISGYIAYHFILLRFLMLQIICIFLLLVYSTTFKRKLLIGNFIIAILTALTLFTVACYEPAFPLFHVEIYSIKIYWLYILFAFLITFCREVIKDIEDIKGDDSQHCKTIPLVWGIQVAKNIVNGCILILVLFMTKICVSSNLNQLLVVVIFGVITLSLLLCIYKIHKATNTFHFHQISQYLKWITLVGIMSMLSQLEDINLF